MFQMILEKIEEEPGSHLSKLLKESLVIYWLKMRNENILVMTTSPDGITDLNDVITEFTNDNTTVDAYKCYMLNKYVQQPLVNLTLGTLGWLLIIAVTGLMSKVIDTYFSSQIQDQSLFSNSDYQTWCRDTIHNMFFQELTANSDFLSVLEQNTQLQQANVIDTAVPSAS